MKEQTKNRRKGLKVAIMLVAILVLIIFVSGCITQNEYNNSGTVNVTDVVDEVILRDCEVTYLDFEYMYNLDEINYIVCKLPDNRTIECLWGGFIYGAVGAGGGGLSCNWSGLK